MLVWLAELLTPHFTFFNVFSYLTFRAILSIITGLVVALWMGPRLIRRLQILKFGQVIRNDGPESHLSKKGTPTMGGLMIIAAIFISVLLWSRLDNPYVWLVLFVLGAYGAIGFADDYLKVVRKNTDGLIARWKYFWQSAVALAVAVFLYATATHDGQTQLVVPFLKDVMPQLGLMFIVLTYFVIVGTSNAVNLTDGLDGLAIMPTVMIAAALAVFAYVAGNAVFARYLLLPYIPGAGELAVFLGAISGAGLGFLWFNAHPAEVFMGDVGALALGGALGTVAVIVRQEIVLAIMGGVFVAETLSVALQVLYFKYSGGKRIFRMAPLHHHYELGGWKETKVVVRFWIITIMLVLVGLSTLKIR